MRQVGAAIAQLSSLYAELGDAEAARELVEAAAGVLGQADGLPVRRVYLYCGGIFLALARGTGAHVRQGISRGNSRL